MPASTKRPERLTERFEVRITPDERSRMDRALDLYGKRTGHVLSRSDLARRAIGKMIKAMEREYGG
jgi:hypothetical protein